MLSAQAEAWQIMNLCHRVTYDQIGDGVTRWNETIELVPRSSLNMKVCGLTDA